MQFLRNILGLEKDRLPAPAAEEIIEVEDLMYKPGPDSTASHPAPTRLRIGWATDVGQVRRHNEDTAIVITASHDGDDASPPFGLFILADGMGGHQAGEIASSLAARTMAHHILQHLYLPTLIGLEQSTDVPSLNEALVNAVQAANNAVARHVPGGGTTLTGALVLGPRVYVAHVGDSRAYIITEQGSEQVTHDHSLVDRLIELGQLSADEAANHPQKNVLYRAIGQGSNLEVDISVRTIPENGRLLLCSDGLWGLVSEETLTRTVMSAPSPQAACNDLIVAANQAGGVDNITMILVEPPLS
ncbi:MAG TPA: serine/threonine-protein phosphatase [Chloroflexi bacterium]|nr:serine/threonine-protein phosphatase [Chloroflexota bacterium]